MADASGTLALVLGGGGLAGIAWELGMITGLAEAGCDVTSADLVVGTSAGSVVGALIATGADLRAAYDAQLVTADGEIAGTLDLEKMMKVFGPAMGGEATQQERRARLGAAALAASDVPAAARREVIAGRLPSHDWPSRALIVTAIDVADGSFVAFDARSGVELVDAVAASCAVPGVWPPAEFNGTSYIDGGLRSTVNADLAVGCDKVLILAPTNGFPNNPFGPSIEEELDGLTAAGQSPLFIKADEASTAAFTTNPLDPETRGPSALAGRRQATAIAEQVKAWLSA